MGLDVGTDSLGTGPSLAVLQGRWNRAHLRCGSGRGRQRLVPTAGGGTVSSVLYLESPLQPALGTPAVALSGQTRAAPACAPFPTWLPLGHSRWAGCLGVPLWAPQSTWHWGLSQLLPWPFASKAAGQVRA